MSRRLQNIHFTGIMRVQAIQGILFMVGVLGYQFITSGLNPFAGFTSRTLSMIFGACVCDSIALMSMCIAFQSDDTAVVSLVGYLAIVYALITDIWIFGETIGTNELLGCALVICITLFVGY